jgi:phage-related protein
MFMSCKPIVWLDGEVKTPPFSAEARLHAGFLLRELQSGILLAMPDSRPMQSIGRRCYELRIADPEANKIWRIIYRIDSDAIIILEIFAKKTQKTPQNIIELCRKRLKNYDSAIRD